MVDRIKSNQGNVETYIESHEQLKKDFAEKVLGFDKKIDQFSQAQTERQIQDTKLAIKTQDILDRAGKNWQRSQEETNKLQEKLGELGKKQPLSQSEPTEDKKGDVGVKSQQKPQAPSSA